MYVILLRRIQRASSGGSRGEEISLEAMTVQGAVTIGSIEVTRASLGFGLILCSVVGADSFLMDFEDKLCAL